MKRFSIVLVSVLLAGCGDAVDSIDVDGAAPPDGASDVSQGTDATAKPDATDASAPDAPSLPITCTGKAPGAYCGGDQVTNGDPSTLYECPGAGQAPTKATPCVAGCVVEPPGTADHCKAQPSQNGYRLPWSKNVTMKLTQDCNDSCCADHVGNDKYAWDFANGGAFTVLAARGGTITHLKINSTTGCGTRGCVNDANVIVIDHGDGTESTYLHLAGNSLAAGITCGATVTQGQALATAGTTGWSTGIHLHYQVEKVHANVAKCECGTNGNTCAANTVPWGSFWPTVTYPTVAIDFDEWQSSQCANRRITMPQSLN